MDEDVPPPPPRIDPLADLSHLSVHELEERIVALKAEIERVEAMLAAKRASRAAADAAFRL